VPDEPGLQAELQPELGFWSLTSLIVGSMIGSGIFFKPGSMLRDAGSVPMVMLAWAVGGVIALSGAFMFADLGAAFPTAGGQAVFVREGLGRRWAFLFSWTGFTVVQSGVMAAVAVALAQAADIVLRATVHAGLPGVASCLGASNADGSCLGFELPRWGVAFFAVGIVLLLSWVNYFGVRRAAQLNNVATVAKVAILAAVVLLAMTARDAGNFSGGGRIGPVTLGGFGLALSASLFAYDGFAQATFVAAEAHDPRRTVPRAIVVGSLVVAALYLLASYAFFRVLPANGISQDALQARTPIALEALQRIVGTGVAAAMAAIIAISAFGTVNSYVMGGPRIYYSAAKHGEFPRAFGVLSRHRTPTYGLWYGAIWASLLALTGGFDALANLTVFGLYVFYLVTVVAYFVLRRRRPEAFQGRRSRLGTLWAVLFGLGAVFVLQSYIVRDLPALGRFTTPLDVLTNTSLFAALLIGAGLLAYPVLRQRIDAG